jgi:hypothetical protein
MRRIKTLPDIPIKWRNSSLIALPALVLSWIPSNVHAQLSKSDCGLPPSQFAQSEVGDTKIGGGFSGVFKQAAASGNYDKAVSKTKLEVYSRYPHADELDRQQYADYVTCVLIVTDPGLNGDGRRKAWGEYLKSKNQPFLSSTTTQPSPNGASENKETLAIKQSSNTLGVAIIALDGKTTVVTEESFHIYGHPLDFDLEDGHSVPYSKVQKVDILETIGRRAQLRLTLTDGSIIDGFVNADQFSGDDKFGQFNIDIDKVKRVEFRR